MLTIALWLLPVAALACWRWSRLVSSALGAALGAWLLYRYAWQWEGLRWVSAATGLAGVVELGSRATMRRADEDDLEHGARLLWAGNPNMSIDACRVAMRVSWDSRHAFGRPDILAILLIWSSLADALSLLLWRKTGLWGVLPTLQAITLAVMIAIGLWPRRKHA